MPKNKIKKQAISYTKPVSARQIQGISVVVCVLIIIVGFLFFGYSYRRFAVTRAEYTKLQWTLAQRLRAYKNLETLISKFEEEKQRFETFLFTDRDVATFLDEFSQFAKESKIEIFRIRAQKQRPVPEAETRQKLPATMKRRGQSRQEQEEEPIGLLMLPMQIGIRGDFLSTVQFLIKLEQYRQLLTVSDVKIEISREGYPFLDTNFLLRLYSISSFEIEKKE
jgi:Tfp pilus assembly protein PilO